MKKTYSIQNFLVILILLVLTGFTFLFIYSNLHLKNRIMLTIINETETKSNLIINAIRKSLLTNGHSKKEQLDFLEYSDIIGINSVEIFSLNGEAAFRKHINIRPEEINLFQGAVNSTSRAVFYDHKKMTSKSFIPLLAEEGCLNCHKKEGDILGMLAIKLSTNDGFLILNRVQRLIWILGLTICLPIAGLFIAAMIIKDKNKLYSKLNKTKHYLQMILDNSKAIIVTTDIDDRIVEFNKESEKVLKYKREELVGENFFILLSDKIQEINILEDKKITNDSAWMNKTHDVEFKAKSGEIVHAILSFSPLLDETGKRVGTVAVGKDVSEQKMLQFKILQSEKLAGIGTLAAGIAHEINNPLTGILGLAEATQYENDIAVIKSYTKDIVKYSLGARDIVKELSGYSRSVRDESTSTVDLAKVMENSLKMAKHSESFVSIKLNCNLQRDCYILANEGEIQQVFVNLMVNAIHAMDEQGSLSLQCVKEYGFVKATVADTGTGIPEKQITQIYNPFFTTKEAGKGTGLGLYVVYRIITKFGGSISADSQVGKGTTFTLKFSSMHEKTNSTGDSIKND